MNNDSLKLEVSREFSCSKDVLYKAWTDADQLKQWWKPMGKQLLNVTNDIREGGTVKYEFDAESLVIEGEYKIAEVDNLLEYSWNWKLAAEPLRDASYTLSVRFEGDGNDSTLYVVQQGFSNEESIDPHKIGWDQALEQLENHLSGNSGEDLDIEKETGKPEVSGYNETPEQLKVGGA